MHRFMGKLNLSQNDSSPRSRLLMSLRLRLRSSLRQCGLDSYSAYPGLTSSSRHAGTRGRPGATFCRAYGAALLGIRDSHSSRLYFRERHRDREKFRKCMRRLCAILDRRSLRRRDSFSLERCGTGAPACESFLFMQPSTRRPSPIENSILNPRTQFLADSAKSLCARVKELLRRCFAVAQRNPKKFRRTFLPRYLPCGLLTAEGASTPVREQRAFRGSRRLCHTILASFDRA